MKLLILFICFFFMAGPGRAGEDEPLKTEKEKLSYAIGMEIGMSLKRQPVEIHSDALARGIKDSLAGNETLITEEEYRKILREFKQEVADKQMAHMKEAAEKNKREGEAFLAENGKKAGVITTKSGLQYAVVKEGTGKTPRSTDTVTVHYRGTLIDGTEFDSSYRRGQPASFPVNGVIPGWTEALQLMKEGGKWHLSIPPELAYGERGAGRQIGPNSTLLFEVELISVQEQKGE